MGVGKVEFKRLARLRAKEEQEECSGYCKHKSQVRRLASSSEAENDFEQPPWCLELAEFA